MSVQHKHIILPFDKNTLFDDFDDDYLDTITEVTLTVRVKKSDFSYIDEDDDVDLTCKKCKKRKAWTEVIYCWSGGEDVKLCLPCLSKTQLDACIRI